MSNPIINPQPNYSGVTIQIMNPAVNLGNGVSVPAEFARNNSSYAQQYCYCQPQYDCNSVQYNNSSAKGVKTEDVSNSGYSTQAYPAQYYLNNYNYQTNGRDITNCQNIPDNNIRQNDNQGQSVQLYNSDNAQIPGIVTQQGQPQNTDDASNLVNKYAYAEDKNEQQEQDFTKSNNIIGDLDDRKAQDEKEKKDTKEKRVVALTDEYIRSLENYLNNPNNDIRLMASKEILTRLDEDKNRYDDAALNALLNKMLQDPSKLVRIAALSAFASQLASGNDYTVKLLQNIQNNPSADKEDVLQAADILLKMSAGTEIKRIPVPKENDSGNKTKGQ